MPTNIRDLAQNYLNTGINSGKNALLGLVGRDSKPNQAGLLMPASYRTEYEQYGIDHSSLFDTPEYRARNYPFTDPLATNFKLLIDWDCPFGLFAGGADIDNFDADEYKNSALGYLLRIGETLRYQTLKKFIRLFREFVRDLDFLILGCEGLQEAYTLKPGNFPNPDDANINFIIRETSRMDITHLMQMYRFIWYDDETGCEVLPINLRRFNCNVLVYSAGYYNMRLYQNNSEEQPKYKSTLYLPDIEEAQLKTYPTLRKLYKIEDKQLGKYDFNNFMFSFYNVQINPSESGKGIFGEISNEMSGEILKTNLTLNYQLVSTSMKFAGVDVRQISALAAANYYHNIHEIGNFTGEEKSEKFSWKNFFSDYGKQLGESLKDAAAQQINTVGSIANKGVNSVLGNNTPIGNALDILSTPSKVVGMASNAISAGIHAFGNKTFDAVGIMGINNWIMNNFSESILTDFVLEKINGKPGSKGPTIALEQFDSPTKDWTADDWKAKYGGQYVQEEIPDLQPTIREGHEHIDDFGTHSLNIEVQETINSEESEFVSLNQTKGVQYRQTLGNAYKRNTF